MLSLSGGTGSRIHGESTLVGAGRCLAHIIHMNTDTYLMYDVAQSERISLYDGYEGSTGADLVDS